MLVDIALLVMYTISLNVFHQFHVVVSALAFILLLLAPCLSLAVLGCLAVNSQTYVRD